MSKKLPDHIDGLIQYLASTSEKANEDLILKYFRKTFGNDFTRQEEADRSDGYVPGHFVLELKGQTNDWLSGLFQGIAYKKSLDFGIVIVAAKNFLAVWSLDDLGEDLITEVLKEKGAPSAVGKRLGSKYQKQKSQYLKKSAYQFPSEYLEGIFKGESSVLLKEVQSFEKTLADRKKVRQKVTTKNFTAILKQMSEYFDPTKPIKVVRAFYSMIFGWNETSLLEISARNSDQAALGGEIIENLIPGRRDLFKTFVESHYIHLSENENIDDFFAMYDQALDAVDPEFRIKNGIFFTDLNLSKFAMWFVKSKLGDIGKDYLVIDPACGSGNLVTNWKSPLELRHKVVSEIEPELLYTVEQRMKGDKWHDGKYTVVPKVHENKGLNFLDISAEEYIEVLKNYLSEKGQKANKPLAFLCNPPYRSDDDQAAENISYDIHPSIVKMTGVEGSSERYACFLAQMKLICEQATDSGLPNESLLFLFTSATWLSKRPVFKEIRSEIFSDFADVGGFLIRSNEFFDVNGSFPIAFTVWKYMGKNANLDSNRPIKLHDLTGIKNKELSEINWSDINSLNVSCEKILKKSQDATCGVDRIKFDKNWIGFGRRNLYRNLTKNERASNNVVMGLPKNDYRHEKKTVYGHANGDSIGFLLDLTPVRTKIEPELQNKPWFYLDSRFLRAKTNRIFSGLPDSRGYCVTDLESAKKLFSWYALSRTFHQVGYPLWVGAEEMWPVTAPKHLESRLANISFAIGYAENDCVETMFPANNPIKGIGETCIHNHLTPLNENSYWSQNLASFFEAKSTNVRFHPKAPPNFIKVYHRSDSDVMFN